MCAAVVYKTMQHIGIDIKQLEDITGIPSSTIKRLSKSIYGVWVSKITHMYKIIKSSSITELLTLLNSSMPETHVEFSKYKSKIQCVYNGNWRSDEKYKLKLHKMLAGTLGYRQAKFLENNPLGS